VGTGVTLDTNVIFNGNALFKTVSASSINSYSNHTALIFNSGTIDASGLIGVDSIVIGPAVVVKDYGIDVNILTSYGNTFVNAGATAKRALYLMDGVLDITNGSLIVSLKVNIENGRIKAPKGLYAITGYDVTYTGHVVTGDELNSNMLMRVYMNTPDTVKLSSDFTLADTMLVSSGVLDLNGKTVSLIHQNVLNTDGIIIFNGGSVMSSPLTNITLSANSSIKGNLKFVAGADTLNNLIINTTNRPALQLGSNLVVNGILNLAAGFVKSGEHNFIVTHADSILGGSASSYVITDGRGMLSIPVAPNHKVTYPIGTEIYYAPLNVTDTTGTVSNVISARVTDTVYSDGYLGTRLSDTRPLVNATWFINSAVATGINYNLDMMWSNGMEVNSFNRAHAYISHYSAGGWDKYPYSIASSLGSMYTISRKNVTSFSPFAVADTAADMTTTNIDNIYYSPTSISIYPNPVDLIMSIKCDEQIKDVLIFDIGGKLIKTCTAKRNSVFVGDLQPGSYIAEFVIGNSIAGSRFIKN